MTIDRRGLLIGAAAVGGGLLVGALGDRLGWWEADLLLGSDPNAAIRRLARARETALVRAYDEALALDATADPRLSQYRQHHLDHLAALGGSPDDVAGAPPLEVPVPADPAVLPEYFATAEQTWATDAQTGVRISPDSALARTFALIAASETTHVWGWQHG